MEKNSELVEAISAAIIRACGPAASRLWSSEDIAAYIGFSVKHTRDRIVTLPGFPACILIGDSQQGRWKADDVRRWVEQASRRKG